METRGDSEIYGEFYRYIDGSKKSLTYLIGVPLWASSTFYSTTQLVKYFNGDYYNIYVCLQNHTSSSLFSSDTSKWKQATYDIQETRDDISVELPLEHDPSDNTFSIKQATTSNVDGGYLSKDDWNIFNNKQDRYVVRTIQVIANTETYQLPDSNDSFADYDVYIYKTTSPVQIVSKFNILYKNINTLDIYIKNDENLITETVDTPQTFNIYLNNNLLHFQNNLGYEVKVNIYKQSFKQSFDPLNP